MLGCYLLFEAFNIEHIQIIPFLLGVFLIIGSTFILDFSAKKIIIDDEYIISETFFFKKKLKLNEISGFSEISPRSSKSRKPSKEFYIYTKNIKYIKITAANWGSDYEKTKDKLKPLAPKKFNEIQEYFHNTRTKIRKGFGYSFGIIVILYSLVSIYNTKEIKRNNLSFVKGTLSNKVELIIRPKRIDNLKIKLNEYPNFNFELSGEIVRFVDKEIKNISVGDSIFLMINKTEFDLKIGNDEEISSFRLKNINWLNIEVFDIATLAKAYLSYKDVNKHQNNPIQKLLLVAFGIFTIIFFKYFDKGYD